MFTGLKSVIYPSADLAKDTAYWTAVLGADPYFNEPYYVGFSVAGFELGLDPNAASEGLDYPVAYWHVADTAAAAQQILDSGAKTYKEIKDVGGLLMGTFKDPSGNIFGIIQEH